MRDKKISKNESITEELLFRHFSHLTSAEEEADIAQWLAEDASQEVYDRYRLFHHDINALQSVIHTRTSYNAEQAWQKIRVGQIATDPKKSTSSGYLKIAASIALLIAIGWLIVINQTPTPIQLLAEDDITMIELHDGSEITLNKGSVLTHPEKFNTQERRVSMVGEAYFEIEKDPDRPFIIETGKTMIQVLGTSFNVVERNGTIEVFVDEGLVKMSSSDEHIYLPAGSSGTFDPNDQSLIKKDQVLIETHQFWRNKQLAFKGARLEDVMNTLDESYAVNTHFENELLKNCSITVTFQDESIERILQIISTTLNISITQVSNQIKIDGKTSCNS